MPVMQKVAFAAALGFGAHAALGGWAVISVENPPEALQAGASYRLEYTVRQHGVALLSGLRGTVVIQPGRAGSGSVSASAVPGQGAGRYSATFRVPETDRVVLTVKSGFSGGGWGDLTLLSIPVVAGGRAAAAVAADERGRQLFVAKGCGTCHVNGDVPEFAQANRVVAGVGPELTGRRLEASYIRRRLTDPASLPPIGSGTVRMPNLHLAAAEVDALVALLSGSGTRAGL